MAEENTQDTTEEQKLVARALGSDIHIPSWVRKEHEGFYKIAYTVVREDPRASQLSSSERKRQIIKFMNQYITGLINKGKENGKQKTEANAGSQKEGREESSDNTEEDVPNKAENNISRRF